MRIGRRHVVHVSVLVAVLVQLGFASAFLVDAAQTNRTYDALAARHVALTGRVNKGPEETDGDLVLAGLPLAGAVLVTVVRVAHLRRRHSRRIR